MEYLPHLLHDAIRTKATLRRRQTAAQHMYVCIVTACVCRFSHKTSVHVLVRPCMSNHNTSVHVRARLEASLYPSP
jgi:hypothetical protein